MSDFFDIDRAAITESEYDARGFVSFQCDPYGDGNEGVEPYEGLSLYGLISRPADPDAGGSASALFLRPGGRGMALPLGDTRVTGKLPECKRGEAVLYGAPGNFVRMQADGGIAAYTTHDGTTSGRQISLTLTPQPRDADGTLDPNDPRCGIVGVTPWATVIVGPTVSIRHVSGAQLNLSSLVGAPPGLGSIAQIRAALLNVEGSAVKIGPSVGVPDNVPKGVPLLAALKALALALTSASTDAGALASALNSVPSGSGAAAAATKLSGDLSAAAAALSLYAGLPAPNDGVAFSSAVTVV